MNLIHHLHRLRIQHGQTALNLVIDIGVVCLGMLIGLQCSDWIVRHWPIY